MTAYYQKYFEIGDGKVRYPGYTRGERWNGFACPYFTKEVGQQIAKDGSTEDYYLIFDEKKDRFVYHDCDCDQLEYEVFEGEDIIVDGENIHVYPIGAFSWIWSDYDHKYSQEQVQKMLSETLIEWCSELYHRILNELDISNYTITYHQIADFNKLIDLLVSLYISVIEQNKGFE